MKLNIFLSNIKPVSVNEIFQFNKKTGRRFHSEKAKEFQKKLYYKLLFHKKRLKEFNHCEIDFYGIKTEFIFYIPTKKLITKKGKLSKTSGDAFNFEKVLTDVLFGFLNYDDSEIIEGVVRKLPSNDEKYNIEINLEFVEIKV